MSSANSKPYLQWANNWVLLAQYVASSYSWLATANANITVASTAAQSSKL
jgi:hypothetical protein